jgi:myo-inositol-1(or 4)-monophosphatase
VTESLNQTLLTLALDIAKTTSEILVNQRPENMSYESKSTPVDLVTEMDKAAERHIVERVKQVRPNDSFLGEEGTALPPDNPSNVKWIIDPIDGTVNYFYNHPYWAISIGVEVDGEIQVGVVAAPLLHETFYAIKDGGAFVLHDGVKKQLKTNTGASIGKALISTGFGYDPERRKKQGALLAEMVVIARDVRRAGAASLDLCYVAAGRLDAYYEFGLYPWDFAAGSLIVSEAGGKVGGLAGDKLGGEWALAANADLFDEIDELVTRLSKKYFN